MTIYSLLQQHLADRCYWQGKNSCRNTNSNLDKDCTLINFSNVSSLREPYHNARIVSLFVCPTYPSGAFCAAQSRTLTTGSEFLGPSTLPSTSHHEQPEEGC